MKTLDHYILLENQLKDKLSEGKYTTIEETLMLDSANNVLSRKVKQTTMDIPVAELIKIHELMKQLDEEKENEALLGLKMEKLR